MPTGIYGSTPPASYWGDEFPEPEPETCDLCGSPARAGAHLEGTVLCCKYCKPVNCLVCGTKFSSQEDDGSHLCDACYDDAGERRVAS